MIPGIKLNNALAALNAVLVTARSMAYDGRPGKLIATVLDTAEYLPRLLAEPDDRTSEFRENLVGLVAVDPGFNFALERFDNPSLSRW